MDAPNDTVDSIIDEPETLARVGAGSFATIYTLRGSPYVLKVAHDQTTEGAHQIDREFRSLCGLYSACNSISFFGIPKPLASKDPFNNMIHTTSFTTRDRTPSTLQNSIPNKERSRVLFGALPSVASAYAMGRVHALPLDMSECIRKLFYPAAMQGQPIPSLCRLYFGKTGEGERKGRFINPKNFPLYVQDYRTLTETNSLSPIEDVVWGMGEMLGRLHWRGGVDARDVEFILGGDGYTDASYYVIGFNQVRTFDREDSKSVQGLVDAYFQNDPYFPVPKTDNQLYHSFKDGYLSGGYPRAGEFLEGIELRYKERVQ